MNNNWKTCLKYWRREKPYCDFEATYFQSDQDSLNRSLRRCNRLRTVRGRIQLVEGVLPLFQSRIWENNFRIYVEYAKLGVILTEWYEI